MATATFSQRFEPEPVSQLGAAEPTVVVLFEQRQDIVTPDARQTRIGCRLGPHQIGRTDLEVAIRIIDGVVKRREQLGARVSTMPLAAR